MLRADQGHANAQFNLGHMFANGTGVAKDSVDAVRLYRLEADQGHADAQFNLGRTFANGKGVAKDSAEAVRLFRLAADQGNANAQNKLGHMFANGSGEHAVLSDNDPLLLVDDTSEDAMYKLIYDCSAARASILFPRLPRDYIFEMIEQCGHLGPEVHDLLRELVGFPMALGNLGVDDDGADRRSLALFAACGTGDLDLVKALLPLKGVQLFEAGCTPWCTRCSTTTHAAEWGHAAIVRFIVDNPPAIYEPFDLDMSLLACVMIGDLARVVALIRQGAEPWDAHEFLRDANAFETEVSSCLRVACTLGNSEMVHVLLGAGAPITITMPAWAPHWESSRPSFRWSELVCVIKRPDSPWSSKLKLPPAGPEDDMRRIDIIRLLVSAGADATEVGLEHDVVATSGALA